MAMTPRTIDANVVADVKPLELCLPDKESSYVFSWLQNYRLHPREPKLAKVGPWRFFLKITYHRPQSSVCFCEIIQFRQRCLGPAVLRNKLVMTGMAHLMLRWSAQMKLVLVTSHIHTIKVP
jgi:hypothetical protein